MKMASNQENNESRQSIVRNGWVEENIKMERR